MVWQKTKKPEDEDCSPVHTLASQLGVERRASVRVQYPQHAHVCHLPLISFKENKLKVHDISVGGCCIVDAEEALGSSIGHEVALDLDWTSARETIQCRIVARVHDRRHIHFVDLSPRRKTFLNTVLAPGSRGQSLRKHAAPSPRGPGMEAQELWSSMLGDAVVLENAVHRLAQVQLSHQLYFIFRESRPVKENNDPVGENEFGQLILFLANIQSPSTGIKNLSALFENLFTGATR